MNVVSKATVVSGVVEIPAATNKVGKLNEELTQKLPKTKRSPNFEVRANVVDCFNLIKKELEDGTTHSSTFLKIYIRSSFFQVSESITEEILLYFKKLYSSPPGESWRVEGIDWSPISEESASRLDSPFAEVEIFNVIFQLDRDKAPGPDGFTIAMFQDCWDVIKEDLVNLDKSNLFGINLDQNHLSRLALMLDCKASDWLILYLGLPLGGNPTTCGFWDPVIERICRRLDGWQKAYLSLGGRITLQHSCLSHIPSYFLSLFKIPASVAAKVERMQQDFLWSGVGEGKKDHLVRWDVVCKPRVKGGLGIEKIPLRNRTLLGKWLWRFPRESTTLWHQVILSIYGTHSNGWDVNTVVRWSHHCPWKAIA
ncbi:putative ribonuclease H protein [Vitis vinifera]|uniref:Putative ribonuclease H protein n=1 Tax=Vitis vinifera TaxID=29760 RepID=A0A438JHL6_VITVI|nr:putative ribonuclease H protein [Vitis vinifera]